VTNTAAPLPSDESTLEVPIDHPEGDVARLTLASGELGHDALITAFKVLRESKSPVHLTLEGPRPKPIFVSVEEAARVLGLPPNHVEDLVRTGWIAAVHWRGGKAKAHQRVTSAAVAESTGDYTGWNQLVLWKDVERLAHWAMKHGHIPSIKRGKPLKAMHLRTSSGNQSKRVAISRLVLNALEAAKDENGQQRWVDTVELYDLVQAQLTSRGVVKPVARETIRSALYRGKSSALAKGYIERREKWSQQDVFVRRAEWRFLGTGQVEAPKEPCPPHDFSLTWRARSSTTGHCTCGWFRNVDLPKAQGEIPVRQAHAEHVSDEREKWDAAQAAKREAAR
jgi:hypothetical protein